jgi:hypothetical protein
MKAILDIIFFRCPASNTFPAVEQFIKSNKEEAIIWIDPTNNYKRKLTKKERKELTPIKLRIVKLVSPDGEMSVLLTNLFYKKEYPKSEIIELYFKRWGHSSQLKKTQKKSSPPNIENLYDQTMKTRAYCVFV